MILSHRLLRYLTPFLHALALLANLALVVVGAGALYGVALLMQVALLAAAALAKTLPTRGAADRALLRAHRRLPRGRPLGLAAPRHPRLVGFRRGHPVTRPDARMAAPGGSLAWECQR